MSQEGKKNDSILECPVNYQLSCDPSLLTLGWWLKPEPIIFWARTLRESEATDRSVCRKTTLD